MKKLLLATLVTLALTSTAAMAWGGGDKGGHGGMRGHGGPEKHLQAQLNLTDAQVQQVKQLHDTQHQQMRAVMTAGQQRIAQLLTADQATKFKEMTDKMQQRWADQDARNANKTQDGKSPDGQGRGNHWGKDGGRGHGGRHGGGFGKGGDGSHMVARLKDKLSLTPEQVTQVEVIVKDQQAQMQQFRQASQAELVKLLTPEQTTKFNELQAERKKRMEDRIQQMQQDVQRM